MSQAHFRDHLQWAFDPSPLLQNQQAFLDRRENKPLEWACWVDFVDQGVYLDAATVSFFSDVFMRLPDLLAHAERKR